MIDSEFVDAIKDLSVQAGHAHIQGLPGDGRKVVITKPTGEVETVDVPVPLNATMERVESVFAWAAKWIGEPLPSSTALFLSKAELVLVQDVNDRRTRVTCPLTMTTHAQHLASPRSLSQEALLELLRIEFAERIDVNVIEKLKAIKFRRDEEGESAVGHQQANATIGRSVKIEAAAGGTIPDKIPVRVRLFKCHDYEADVTCAVMIDLDERKFKIVPIAEEFDQLLIDTLDKIAALRTEKHPPLYFGGCNS